MVPSPYAPAPPSPPHRLHHLDLCDGSPEAARTPGPHPRRRHLAPTPSNTFNALSCGSPCSATPNRVRPATARDPPAILRVGDSQYSHQPRTQRALVHGPRSTTTMLAHKPIIAHFPPISIEPFFVVNPYFIGFLDARWSYGKLPRKAKGGRSASSVEAYTWKYLSLTSLDAGLDLFSGSVPLLCYFVARSAESLRNLIFPWLTLRKLDAVTMPDYPSESPAPLICLSNPTQGSLLEGGGQETEVGGSERKKDMSIEDQA
ncbi:hypothetical protein B0H14DRAFT_3731895 [Mycena olivaceomarginata]|nr:hypothetical protein B0H14DRAFT_3731895 [Mycena olivaceomarginata]